jgi:hypothetical protein
MKRVRGQKSAIVRRGIGLFLAVLLAFSPALNLIVIPSAAAAPSHHQIGHHHGAAGDHKSGDCSGFGHLDLKCLQCLAMGGMSLTGAEIPPAPVPSSQSIDATWSLARHRLEPVSVCIPISRGPPSFA